LDLEYKPRKSIREEGKKLYGDIKLPPAERKGIFFGDNIEVNGNLQSLYNFKDVLNL
jgi:hypothetical protein